MNNDKKYFEAIGEQMAVINNALKVEEVEELDHDCHLSPEDGCEVCGELDEIQEETTSMEEKLEAINNL